MIALSHPTGNTFSRALLRGLLKQGELAFFATSIAMREENLKFFPRGLRRELERRRFDVPSEKLVTRPGREILRLAANRLGFPASVDAIYRDVDTAVAKRLQGVSGVYCYEDGALRTFRAARDLGVRRFYELPIAYWETGSRLLREEAERWPQWEPTLIGTRDSEQKLRNKTEELELAEVVICPSRFVLESIPSELRNAKAAVVAEFGSPLREKPPEFRAPGKKLRALFAGSMSQRKGLADLFAAMKRLKGVDVELVVMGSALAPMDFYRRDFADFIYEAPRPHAEFLKLMETCDVLVLPSIVEGRALVQQEAMACGLPLIVTANAGGEDLIQEERTGFLVPIRSPEAIAEKLEWFAQNRARLPEMKRAAYEKARALTWERYVEKIFAAIGLNG